MAQAIEKLDIGGPSLVRAAAKNQAFVTIVTSPDQYPEVAEEIRGSGGTQLATRQALAVAAFCHTAAYDAAVTRGIELARAAAARIDDAPHLELVMDPQLSVVLFRRRGGDADTYQAWSDRALDEGLGLLVPPVQDGETMFRFCFVNPTTALDDIDALLDAMR